MPLGSAFIAATAVGEFDVVLTNAEFLSFLDADSNQQITLAFYDEATANSQWHIASIGNTAGYLKPTLALQVTPAPGNPRITSVELVGSNLRLVGTNVPASSGRPYWVIMSNNVTRTLSGWGHVTNGAFAANGRFTNTMPVSGALQFFIIEVP